MWKNRCSPKLLVAIRVLCAIFMTPRMTVKEATLVLVVMKPKHRRKNENIQVYECPPLPKKNDVDTLTQHAVSNMLRT